MEAIMFKRISTTVIVLLILLSLNLRVFATDFEGKIVTKSIAIEMNAADKNYSSANDAKKQSISKNIMEKSTTELKTQILGSPDAKAPLDGPYTEMEVEVWIQGSKMAMEMEHEGKNAGFIIDVDTRDMAIIQHEEKMVIKMNLDKMSQSMPDMMKMAEQMQQEPEKEKPDQFNLKATGKKKTINSYSCELYSGTGSDGEPMIAWLSKDLADELRSTFIKMNEALDKINPEDAGSKEADFFMKEKGVPIIQKSVQHDELNIIELVKIEKTKVPSGKFEIPAGYQEMDMMKMMQGFGF
jgi:hypothetical protein